MKILFNFFDAKDVFFVDTPENIMKVFYSMNASIVYSAEYNCWPKCGEGYKWPEVPKGHPQFLNTGVYIGYVKYLKPLIRDMLKMSIDENVDDDQEITQKVYHTHKYPITLDYNVQLYQNMYSKNSTIPIDLLPNNKFKNEITNNAFKMFHYNGHPDVEKILIKFKPMLEHLLKGRESLLDELYPNATFTVWNKCHKPNKVNIRKLCLYDIISPN